MAKILQDIIAITVSKAVKDDVEQSDYISKEKLFEIEEIVTSLLGDGLVVEVRKLDND